MRRPGTRGMALVAMLLGIAPGCSALIDLDPKLKETPLLCASDDACDDGIECTHDTCAPVDGACSHSTDHALCASDELCLEGAGCTPRRLCVEDADCIDGNPCNGEERCEDNACRAGEPLACDDELFCNGQEACDPVDGCVPGEPERCLDGIDCTADECDPALDECVHAPLDAACDDGAFCNGVETCSAVDGCQVGTAACDDGIDCTEDQCVEDGDRCLVHGDHARCAEGEICVAAGDPVGCVVRACAGDEECDDGDACNGVETCFENFCTGNFIAPCDDDVFCNGQEYCDELGACYGQSPPTCADGVECTLDTCELGADACQHAPSGAFCSDGLVCNGAEVCAAAGCEVGVAFDCEDGSACTLDACDENAAGCVSVPGDDDGDLAGDAACGGDDCDDTDPFVGPGSAEVCNDRDDDCDLDVDEDLDCRRGQIDLCTTPCGSAGVRLCTASCEWTDCMPPAEDCNGVDDDCNGQVDEGCGCSPQDPTDCPTVCGTTGSRECVGGAWSACEPPPESCNGIDDDCDESIDEGFECIPGAQGGCNTECGSDGTTVCTVTCTWGACQAPAEVCNGVDDDCAGGADDGFACVRGTTQACEACGGTGTQTCGNTCTWGACQEPAEVCDGIDNDCDALCDEGFACCEGSYFPCETGCGTEGVEYCAHGCTPSGECYGFELCFNGIDDDCDEAIDYADPDCCEPCCWVLDQGGADVNRPCIIYE